MHAEKQGFSVGERISVKERDSTYTYIHRQVEFCLARRSAAAAAWA